MSKTNEELSKLKEDYEALINRLVELDEKELKEVTGGASVLPNGQEITIRDRQFRNIPHITNDDLGDGTK